MAPPVGMRGGGGCSRRRKVRGRRDLLVIAVGGIVGGRKVDGLVGVHGAAGVGQWRGEAGLGLRRMGDTERQLYGPLRRQVAGSTVVGRLLGITAQVGFTVTPHLARNIGREAVDVQLHTLFHQPNHNSPGQTGEAGDLVYYGRVLA